MVPDPRCCQLGPRRGRAKLVIWEWRRFKTWTTVFSIHLLDPAQWFSWSFVPAWEIVHNPVDWWLGGWQGIEIGLVELDVLVHLQMASVRSPRAHPACPVVICHANADRLTTWNLNAAHRLDFRASPSRRYSVIPMPTRSVADVLDVTHDVGELGK